MEPRLWYRRELKFSYIWKKDRVKEVLMVDRVVYIRHTKVRK